MTVDWTYELMIYSGILMLFFVLFAVWTKNLLRSIFLLVGLFGLWLAIAAPSYAITKDKKTTTVTNIQDFLISKQAKKTDTVILEGLDYPLEDLDLLDSFQVKWVQEQAIKRGFYNMRYNKRVVENEEVVLEGMVHGADSSEVNVVLELPSGDEIKQRVKSSELFEFRFKALLPGLYEYKLKLINGLDTLTEMLPLQVITSASLNMLIYSAQPGFELNYLKNHWVGKGHGIVQKVRVSKNKFNISSVNTPLLDFDRVTKSVIEQFDLVMLDFGMWNALGASERRIILNAVETNALGVILIPMRPGDIAQNLPFNKLVEIEEQDFNTVSIQRYSYALTNVWRSFDAGYQYMLGYGSIVLPKYNGTYQLILADESTEYDLIWANIFSEAYAQYVDGFTVTVPFLTFANEDASIKLYNVRQEDSLYVKGEKLPLLNIPLLENVAAGNVIPDEGWNKIHRKQDKAEAWFYAHQINAWSTWKKLVIKDKISKMVENNQLVISKTYRDEQKLPWWLSLSIFLVGFGTLWLIEKLH